MFSLTNQLNIASNKINKLHFYLLLRKLIGFRISQTCTGRERTKKIMPGDEIFYSIFMKFCLKSTLYNVVFFYIHLIKGDCLITCSFAPPCFVYIFVYFSISFSCLFIHYKYSDHSPSIVFSCIFVYFCYYIKISTISVFLLSVITLIHSIYLILPVNVFELSVFHSLDQFILFHRHLFYPIGSICYVYMDTQLWLHPCFLLKTLSAHTVLQHFL